MSVFVVESVLCSVRSRFLQYIGAVEVDRYRRKFYGIWQGHLGQISGFNAQGLAEGHGVQIWPKI